MVSSSEMYGVARQFMGYAGELVEGEVFYDLDEAEAWLRALDSACDPG